jgi:hypothetical protein
MNTRKRKAYSFFFLPYLSPHFRASYRTGLSTYALLVWLINHQPAVFFSQNKPATSNKLAVLFSQNKSALAISHQPNEHAGNGPCALAAARLSAREKKRDKRNPIKKRERKENGNKNKQKEELLLKKRTESLI